MPRFGRAEEKEDKKMAVPNKKAPLGQGGRFAAIAQDAARSGARNPAAVAAAAGIAAHGKEQMAKWAAAGRKRASLAKVWKGRKKKAA